ncbi:MAG TPA: hypothetical protein VEL73_03875, partial [Mycobacteriales bacterium]|nr:hypothetical protein [Mycobacteriales bacterium]
AAAVLCERTTLERLTIVAIVDGAALLLDADDATSARLLLGLAVDDATATDVLTALATPARRPGAGTGPDAGTQ